MKILKLLSVFFFIFSSASAQLTGMTNNSAIVGTQHLNTTITSNGSFVQASSPNGNINEIYLRQGGTVIRMADWSFIGNMWNAVNIIDPNTVDVTDFGIPATAPTGNYTLYVGYLDPQLQIQQYPSSSIDSLPNAFTVLPPDGYIQGTVYDDKNKNGIQDAGENGVANGTITLNPGNILYNLNSAGFYSIPVINGNYTVTWNASSNDRRYLTSSTASYNVTINFNNSTGNDFGVKRKIISILPTQIIDGTQSRLTILTDSLFISGGTFSYLVLDPAIGSAFYSNGQNLSVTDVNTGSALIATPTGRTGVCNGYIYIQGGSNMGYHFFDTLVTIVPSPATISGRIYFDANNNGLYDTITDVPLRYQRVHLMPDDAYAYSDATGNYRIGALYGPHTISWDPVAGNTFVLSSDSASFTFTSSGPVNGKDFGLISGNPDYSCEASITSTRPRCNTNNGYYLTFTNTGNVPFNGRLNLRRDLLTTFNGSTPVASGSNAVTDTVYWNLQNVQPFQPTTIFIYLLMPGAGNTISNGLFLQTYDSNNQPQLTASANLNETILCSFDPNDKACTPEGIDIEHYTLIGTELEYKIRFQNTGNDTAYDVNIYDQLDANLDWSSLRVIESSHSAVTTVDNNGNVCFSFRNIYLPDSAADEPGSNGFIIYRINAIPNIADYTLIENTAHIVFDLNPAVITNTTYNLMVTQIPLWIKGNTSANATVNVYPNPVRESAVFNFDNTDQRITRFEVFDITGRSVYTKNVAGGEFVFNKNGLSTGLYQFRLSDNSGSIVHSGKMVIE